MASTEDLLTRKSLTRLAQESLYTTDGRAQQTSKLVSQRVDLLTAHLFKQLKEHDEAIRRTNQLFEKLLVELEQMSDNFQRSFLERNIDTRQIYSQIDADRSVGILNILWHSLSFTARGNTRPMALQRFGRTPLFTGRIVALHGDFHQLALSLPDQDYPDLLQFELASLYVPADPTAPTIMTVKHMGNQEQYLHQADAVKLFLIKTIEMVCGGGDFHELEA